MGEWVVSKAPVTPGWRPHSDCTACKKTQNAQVRGVGSPRVPRDLRGIAVASTLDAVGPPRTPCKKCAPWLGVPTAIWMSAVRTPWVCNGNAVTAQWGLLECHEGRIWSPQERRCRLWRLHGDPTECMETSQCYSLRVNGVCTAQKLNFIYSIAPSRRCRSDHSSQLRFTKENGTQATFMNV